MGRFLYVLHITPDFKIRLTVLSHLYVLFRQLNSSSREDFGLGKLDMHFKIQTLDVQCAFLHVPLLSYCCYSQRETALIKLCVIKAKDEQLKCNRLGLR